MRKITIRGKMTVWYGIFLLTIIITVMFTLVGATRYMTESTQQQALKAEVESDLSRVHTEDGNLNIDNSLKNKNEGIDIMIYEDGNFLISGIPPLGVPGNIAFEDNKIRKIKTDDTSYYVYDRLIDRDDYINIWVRGIISADIAVIFPALDIVTKAVLILLPILTLIALYGGSRMTRRALEPLGSLSDTAKAISTGKDLSIRIPEDKYTKEKDELQDLISTFNGMLDRLDNAFLTETRFTDDASHELRTPVSVIMAQCEYARENAETPEEYREAIEVIFKQSKNMHSLLTQLLTLARADKGTNIINKEETDLSILLDIVCDELKDKAETKNITIHKSVKPDVYFNGDQTLLTILFMNLVSNAITYGKECGNINVELSIGNPQEYDWSSAEEITENSITVKVTDDGIGIPKDEIPKIWERFYQVDPARSKTEESNSGLGLSMVRWIVQEHGGVVTCSSTEGKGTEFTVYFPTKGEEQQ